MKKIIIFALIIGMLSSFAGCSEDTDSSETDNALWEAAELNTDGETDIEFDEWFWQQLQDQQMLQQQNEIQRQIQEQNEFQRQKDEFVRQQQEEILRQQQQQDLLMRQQMGMF